MAVHHGKAISRSRSAHVLDRAVRLRAFDIALIGHGQGRFDQPRKITGVRDQRHRHREKEGNDNGEAERTVWSNPDHEAIKVTIAKNSFKRVTDRKWTFT